MSLKSSENECEEEKSDDETKNNVNSSPIPKPKGIPQSGFSAISVVRGSNLIANQNESAI